MNAETNRLFKITLLALTIVNTIGRRGLCLSERLERDVIKEWKTAEGNFLVRTIVIWQAAHLSAIWDVAK